jgi:ubiquitin-like protein Pup
MSEQVHAHRTQREEMTALAEEAVQSEDAKAARERLAELDELMDDIDALLAETGTEFADAYVQKGGE